MLTKKFLTLLLIVVISWSSSVVAVSASSVSAKAERVELLSQIEKLLVEVLRLQKLLSQKNTITPKITDNYTPYQSVFFPLSFESIYEVRDGKLLNTKSSGGIREVDRQIFEIFTKVIGESEVRKYVKEWRVFNDTDSELGAFVELIAGTSDWVVGVNREGFTLKDDQVVASFVNLFLHEYAHILLFKNPDFEKSFKANFWTTADLLHASKVEKASPDKRFDLTSGYYEKNQDRFVSDYATMNFEEDLSETFVSFVRDLKPLGTTTREKKLLAFYQNQEFVKLRTLLRTNLAKLNSLE